MDKNILLISDKFPPHFGGMESHAFEFLKYFSKNNKYNTIGLTFKYNQIPDNKLKLTEFNYKKFNKKEGITIKDTLNFESTTKPKEIIEYIKNNNLNQNDIIFFNSLWWIRVIDEIKKEYPKMKIYLRSGGNDILQSNITGKGNTLIERQKYVVNQINTSIDKLFVNSNYSENEFEKLGISKNLMFKISGGVDTYRFHPLDIEDKYILKEKLSKKYDFDSKAKIILGTSRLVKFKGFEYAIESISKINKDINFNYLIVGDGPLKKDLEEKVKNLNQNSEKIKFLGNINFENINQIYQVSDLYFHFPIKDIVKVKNGEYTHTETMGRSFCEASSSGIPIITSNVGGISSIVKENYNGYLIQEKNTNKATNKLEELLLNQEKRESISKNARQIAKEKYSWDYLFNQYEKIFNEN